jgi:thiol-disulfide isomerase/thioredoxin
LEDTNGKVYKLADFKDEKLYIMFWASWCPHCVNGLDETNELPKKSNGIKVITIISPDFAKEMDKY